MSDILCDSFTGTNGTAITAHTPESGTAASAAAGGAQIQSNKLSFTSPAVGANNYTRWTGSGDGTTYATFQFTTPAAGNRYLEFYVNRTDANNSWFINYFKHPTSGEKFRIYEIASGVITQRATSTVVLLANTTYTVVIKAVGDTITATLYGLAAPVVDTYTVASRSSKTAVGFSIETYTDASGDFDQGTVFDNFRVTTTDLFAAIYVDTTLATTAFSGYDPVTFLPSVTGAGVGIPLLSDALTTYLLDGAYVYCRGGQSHTTGIAVALSCHIRQFGVGTATLTARPAYAPGAPGYGLHVVGAGVGTFSLVGVRGNLKMVGTFDDGDASPDPDLDSDITLAFTTGGVVTVQGVWFDGFGHAGIKFLFRAGSGSVIEQCRFARGGFTGRDHCIYDAKGNVTYRHNEFYDVTGYGIQAYSSLPDPVSIIANVFRQCGNVGGIVGGGTITDGVSGHVIRHNTVVDCGIGANGFGHVLWGGSNTTTVQNNFCANPAAGTTDINIQNAATTTITTGYNRKVSLGGAGSAAYTSATDVVTADLFDTTPATLTAARRTGGLADGVDTGADSDVLLDPTQDWPTPMAVSGIPPIGAFANVSGGPTTGSFSRGIAVRHHRTQLRIGRRL